MSSAFIGVIGTLLGVALKWVIDLVTEARRHAREDIVWRRERFTDAAAELLAVCREVVAGNQRIIYAVHSYTNAQQGNNAEIVESCRRNLLAEQERFFDLPGRARSSFERLRLYAPSGVTTAAQELLNHAHATPEITKISDHLRQHDDLDSNFANAVRTVIDS